jgi:hypothetical protein
MLSDSDLIHQFVTDSVQGREVLLANRSLRAQQVYSGNQLFDRSGAIVLSVQPNENQTEFLARSNSPYWSDITAALAAHSYLMFGGADAKGFVSFQYCKLPEGYQLFCTPANYLWKVWWHHRRQMPNRSIPLDLLTRSRSAWYGVRDIVYGQGFIYIKTLGDEIDVTMDDLVIWSKKISPKARNLELSCPHSAAPFISEVESVSRRT